MKKILLPLALAAFAAGCQSYQYNKGGDSNLRPTIVRDVAYEKFNISNNPITVSVTGKFLKIGPMSISLGSTWNEYADNVDENKYCDKLASQVRNQAYARACAEAKCDSIVGAQYKIARNDYPFYQEITVELKGYPAKFTGVEFRPAVFSK